MGEADLAGPVLARKMGRLRELVGGDAAARHAQPDGGVGAAVLGGDADVVVAAQGGGVRGTVTQCPSDAVFELGAERVGADTVEQELEACLAAGGAVLVGVAEDPGDLLDDLDRLLGRDEYVDPPREAWC